MAKKFPKIVSLKPTVYADNRRVMMEMIVKDLPSMSSNITLEFPNQSNSASTDIPETTVLAASPYPDVELTILDSHGSAVATIFIVEHQEEMVNLTLHIREPDINEQYTARAEMTYQGDTLEIIEVPFTLNRAD